MLPDYEKIDLILQVIGTVAFAFSGALVAVRKNMDLMGVLVLGLTTAVGGGIVRDMLLGVHPPKTFLDTRYILFAIASSLLVFVLCYINKEFINSETLRKFERINAIFDAIGLGAFTVTGINSVINSGYGNNFILMIFCGVLTGVGGGALRDIFADVTPFIFREDIYASAALVGSVFYIVMSRYMTANYVMIFTSMIVCAVRILALEAKVGLPKIK